MNVRTCEQNIESCIIVPRASGGNMGGAAERASERAAAPLLQRSQVYIIIVIKSIKLFKLI